MFTMLRVGTVMAAFTVVLGVTPTARSVHII